MISHPPKHQTSLSTIAELCARIPRGTLPPTGVLLQYIPVGGAEETLACGRTGSCRREEEGWEEVEGVALVLAARAGREEEEGERGRCRVLGVDLLELGGGGAEDGTGVEVPEEEVRERTKEAWLARVGREGSAEEEREAEMGEGARSKGGDEVENVANVVVRSSILFRLLLVLAVGEGAPKS